jgi:hypothetical protein
MRAAAQLSLPLERAQSLSPGLWRRRDGGVVEITHKLSLPCTGPHGRFVHEVWAGRCLCCNAKCTWELDGRYAAVGTHDFDLIAKEPNDG